MGPIFEQRCSVTVQYVEARATGAVNSAREIRISREREEWSGREESEEIFRSGYSGGGAADEGLTVMHLVDMLVNLGIVKRSMNIIESDFLLLNRHTPKKLTSRPTTKTEF